jgi:hypothetical protein
MAPSSVVEGLSNAHSPVPAATAQPGRRSAGVRISASHAFDYPQPSLLNDFNPTVEGFGPLSSATDCGEPVGPASHAVHLRPQEALKSSNNHVHSIHMRNYKKVTYWGDFSFVPQMRDIPMDLEYRQQNQELY